jgi:MFS family permease
MGLATFAVALVPTYESIGIWVAVVLTVLRFIQGIGVGGEWGGSVLMSMEWARTDHSRGFIASWPQFGVPCGLFLANLAVLALSQMSGEHFLAWGWRIPFALSLVLVGVGLYIRLGILETPVFAKLLAERKVERTPMLVVQDYQMDEVMLAAGSRAIVFFGAANRDERKFSDPHRFDVTRNAAEQLAFGSGPHACIGLHLAKLEMTEIFRALARRVKRFSIEHEVRNVNNTLRGFRKLMVGVETL